MTNVKRVSEGGENIVHDWLGSRVSVYLASKTTSIGIDYHFERVRRTSGSVQVDNGVSDQREFSSGTLTDRIGAGMISCWKLLRGIAEG